jgi:hypothetical protein
VLARASILALVLLGPLALVAALVVVLVTLFANAV